MLQIQGHHHYRTMRYILSQCKVALEPVEWNRDIATLMQNGVANMTI